MRNAKTSLLAWVRQPPGKPVRRAFAAVFDRLSTLHTMELDPALTSVVYPERLRRLRRERAGLTAQHLTTLLPTRRNAVLVATGLETQMTLTDDAVMDLPPAQAQDLGRVRDAHPALDPARQRLDAAQLALAHPSPSHAAPPRS